MAFDEEKFRKLAKEANHSDDEIEAVIAKQRNLNTATGQEFGADSEKYIQQKAQELRDAGSPIPGTQEPRTEQSTLSKMFDFVKTPAGTAAATGAAIGLVELARRGLASRKTATPEIAPQIEPTFTPPAAPAIEAPKAPAFTGNAQPTAMPAQQPYGTTTITGAPTGIPQPVSPPAGAAPQPVAPVELTHQQKMEQLALETAQHKRDIAAANAQMAQRRLETPAKTVASGKAATPGYSEAEMKMVQQGGAASASKALEAQKIAGSVTPRPDPIAATATPAEKASAVAVVQQSELKTGSGFPAHAGKAPPVEDITKFRMPAGGDLGDLSKLPSNLAFVPGVGPGLNTARQELGQEAAQALARQQGLPWGEYNAARARLDEFNKERIGPALTREQRKSIGAPLLENTPGIGMKAGKALGVLGAIMSVADLAKAAEQTKEGKYTEAAKTVAPVVDPTGLASAAISPESTAQSLANVSPIMGILSQLIGEESKTKAKREYARKVGAGRGIAPPSAYQR